ncbi:Oxidase ustYa [Psilocybe cubensis]|uniref:Uncharacterized protein n=2 Tax=Psilocybe cubensis TaxID=181762 RepID=A0A8H7Y6B6_PSICU|nr:Oxidase ustYa [Psilocybe cubensis]KAH9484723.1 Oxidase ustYa [Psilocybe cubensis]
MISTRAKSLLAAIALFNVSLAFWNGAKTLVSRDKKEPYSYIGADFPFVHPSLPISYASLTYQESIWPRFNSTDKNEAAFWRTLTDQPKGMGRIHLGEHKRALLFTFYHQFHCIFQLQRALQDRTDAIATLEHVNHCFQYLRQTLLCSASDTLEMGDFMKRNFDTDPIGPESVCINWEIVFGDIDQRWDDSRQWLELWN